MFTGLINTIGTLKQRRNMADGMKFFVACHFQGENLQKGESIAVDGICVTVEDFDNNGFQFSSSRETLRHTTIGQKLVGDQVHLERALRIGDRLGGHLVQGHVDGIGEVKQLALRATGADLSISVPPSIRIYLAEKGSLAVQGVSLTIAAIAANQVTFALVPATLERTYLGQLQPGDRINLEVDIIAKYVAALLGKQDQGIDERKLTDWGFY